MVGDTYIVIKGNYTKTLIPGTLAAIKHSEASKYYITILRCPSLSFSSFW